MTFYNRIMSSAWRRLSTTDKAQECANYLCNIVPAQARPQIRTIDDNPVPTQVHTMLLDHSSQFCLLACGAVIKDLAEELESAYSMLRDQ